MALPGALTGLLVGVVCAAVIIGTGGLGAIAIGAALATAGGLGMAGECIGKTIQGPPCGAITIGSPNVLINGIPAARAVLSLGSCAKEYGVPQPEATGASTVFINGMPAGRVSEKLACSAVIISGSPNVFIGGASGQSLPLTPEVPVWLDNTMLGMALGGTIIATGGIAFTYGIGPAIGSLVGGVVGGHYGGEGGQWLARQVGAGETGQAISQVAGGFLGGMLGGGAGFRGGRFVGNRGALGGGLADSRAPMENEASGTEMSKLDEAATARDQLAADLKENEKRPPAAVTAGYNIETGEVAAAASGNRRCAEENVVDKLGGDPSKVQFTPATRPRTGEEVPVCGRCQEKYDRSQFPAGTRFAGDPED